MPKLAMYFHGGSGNHGCEAIIRSTAKILGGDITLYSSNPGEDYQYNIDEVVTIREDSAAPLKRGSWRQVTSALSHKLRDDDYLFTINMHRQFFENVQRGDVYLSVGGDNYCYKGQDILEYYNRGLHKRGAKTVLWGCSINPDELTPRIEKDLSHYDLVVARESISYDTLRRINSNTVLYPDPAFCLDTQETDLSADLNGKKIVGVNLSPLITEYGNGKKILDNYRNLMKHIINHTDFQIAMIPHVVKPGNDDRTVLNLLYNEFHNSGRVTLIPDGNCMQLKSIIGKCRFFIGARTHATIAAYSQCVPTLVAGYSTKSIGIARDLFGTEQHYVLPVQRFETEMDLTRAFEWLLENGEGIQKQLKKQVPAYKDKLNQAGSITKKLL